VSEQEDLADAAKRDYVDGVIDLVELNDALDRAFKNEPNEEDIARLLRQENDLVYAKVTIERRGG
jgi:hypothetical protein